MADKDAKEKEAKKAAGGSGSGGAAGVPEGAVAPLGRSSSPQEGGAGPAAGAAPGGAAAPEGPAQGLAVFKSLNMALPDMRGPITIMVEAAGDVAAGQA